MAGLRAGILAGRSGVISAMRAAAREAVNAAKKELKIKSPSQVFRDEVGVMTMRGFGAGVLKESKEQAEVILQTLPAFSLAKHRKAPSSPTAAITAKPITTTCPPPFRYSRWWYGMNRISALWRLRLRR